MPARLGLGIEDWGMAKANRELKVEDGGRASRAVGGISPHVRANRGGLLGIVCLTGPLGLELLSL